MIKITLRGKIKNIKCKLLTFNSEINRGKLIKCIPGKKCNSFLGFTK